MSAFASAFNPYILTILIVLPIAGALVIAFLPKASRRLIYGFSIAVFTLTFICSLHLPFRYDIGAGGMQFALSVNWISTFGISYAVAADGVAVLLIVLTTFVFLAGAIATGSVESLQKEYAVALCILEAAVIGVFSASDMLLFYVFWEAMLIPAALLIAVWGGAERIRAAYTFFFFTFAGSIFMLIAMIVLANQHVLAGGTVSFAIADAPQTILALRSSLAPQAFFTFQLLLFLGFMAAFAVKTALFPLHIWAPDTYSQAPTFVTVVLAAVLLKMGGYGIWRFILPLFPDAVIAARPYVMMLGVIGIVYAAVIAITEKNIKRVIAYASVSHIGLAVAAMFSLTVTGITGGILQLVVHGIAIGMIFLLAGMLFRRSMRFSVDEHGGLAKAMPLFSIFFVVSALAVIGLPMTGNFIAEILSLMGIMQYRVWMGVIAVLGPVLSAVYALTLVRKTVFGPLSRQSDASLGDIKAREAAPLAVMLILVIIIGVYPKPVLSLIEPGVKAMLASHYPTVMK
ncbi:MAG: NADH-quinone oxidoreductase subunit M [Spirochaetes bacterium]|nr:NADH-quinone oxidoreductase subunit M [Spirochaetota bacterium]